MAEYPPVKESLAKLQAWMLENSPGVSFRPPADPLAMDNFNDKSGLVLPGELRQTLLMADGETRKSAGAIGNWRLMPIAEIQAAWGLLRQLVVKGAFEYLTPNPSPYFRQYWWHLGWIPFVSSDLGDFYCIDTDPPEPSRSEQILLYLKDQPARPLVAPSISAWFSRITRDLDDGVYTYDDTQGFNGEAFLWSSLEGKHLLDDLPGTLMVVDDN